jgi:hypothetical protein
MNAEFTKFDNTTEWVSGTVGGFRFEAKLNDTTTSYGINGGRVSKLIVFNESLRRNVRSLYKSMIIHWDKSWDIKPTKKTAEEFNSVMRLLESSPKRFN